MLAQILAEFDRERRPLSSRELASMLDKDLAAIEGMLETLVSSGRLLELGGEGPCDECPVQGLCIVLPFDDRRFYLVPQEGRDLSVEHGTCWEARDQDGS